MALNTQKIINKLSHFNASLTQLHTNFEHRCRFNFHGVLVEICMSSSHLKTKIINHYKNYLTEENVTEPYQIFWQNPEDFDVADFVGESPDPNCQFFNIDGVNTVIQRDFIAVYSDKKINLIAHQQINDGIFNFLRWFLPHKLLTFNKLVLHSSCVINEENKAYVCLGPSGAGKTTIASLAEGFRILGDDMNILEFIDGAPYISASGMGQRFENPGLYGQQFLVKKFFWLKQSTHTRQTRMDSSMQYTHILASFANLFWDQLSESEISKVQSVANKFLQTSNFYQLEFPKVSGVWNDIKEFK